MVKEVVICGDVNRKGKMNIPLEMTIKEILENYGGGFVKNRSLKLVQIGGPLGVLLSGADINKQLSEYEKYLKTGVIMYYGDVFCPVDYLRFLTRYVIRELKVDTPFFRSLNEKVELIAQGKSSNNDFVYLVKVTEEEKEHTIEKNVSRIFSYALQVFKDEFIEHIESKKCRCGICRGLITTQCINACPAEVNVPGYIELMKQGDVEKAYQLMRQRNPLSFICGKVCARPCEDRCRRGEIESSVGVRALKYYAANMALKVDGFKEITAPLKNKKVGIIGSGPAGLTAAYYLALTGYDVTIYEAESVVGGMLATGIPAFRLEQFEIDKEVQLILDLGVKIKTNTRVGVDVPFSELEQKYDAILLATGCPEGIKLGPKCNEIESAVDYLRAVKVENRKATGKHTMVIGGGDVAFDAARTAVRLGAESVTLVSLEKKKALPASEEDIEAAIDEGVQLYCGHGVHDFEFVDNTLDSIVLKKCTSLVDTTETFNPQYDLSETLSLKVDHVIYAIGQRADISYLEGKLETSNKRIVVDDKILSTSVKNIFVAGDLVSPGIAIKAIDEGRRSAESIDIYFGGKGLWESEKIKIPDSVLDCTIWDIERISDELIESEKDAKKEASRCMRCDRNSTKPLFLR